jgi:hypothetical protein
MKEEISLESVAGSALKVDPETVYRKVSGLLPIELRVLDRISKPLVAAGHPCLDKKYPRIDIPAALASRIKQRGIPYPVPRFAMFNVDDNPVSTVSSEIRVEEFKATRIGTALADGYYGSDLMDDMAETSRRGCRNFRAVLWFGLALASAGLIIGQNALFQSWSWQPVVMLVAGIMAGVAALILGGLYAGIEGMRVDITESISAGFSGILPDATRDKVKEAKANGLKDVFLLCEVDPDVGWERQTTSKSGWKPSISADPLVVGLRNGAWYLVDKFDLTPAENWVASEMTS